MQDCTSNEAPPSSNTLWLPSANSVNLATTPVNTQNGNNPAVQNNQLPVSIIGVNFDTFTNAGQARFCLGRYNTVRNQAMSCTAGCDPARPTLTSTTQAGVASNLNRLLTIPFESNPASATSYNSRVMELEAEPRKLCWDAGNNLPAARFIWTGIRIGVAWSCDDSQTTQSCTNYIAAAQVYPLITSEQLGLIQARTTCCRRITPTYLFPAEFGVCINPNTTACCGGTAVELTQERCCNSAFERTAYHEGTCRCGVVTERAPPPGSASNALIQVGGNADCPFDGSLQQECCLPTKYPEMTAGATLAFANGQCFNPVKHRCCNTGDRYDPGSHQCCSINGVQTLNVPCPCDADGDCNGGQTRGGQPVAATFNNVFACCRQSSPVPIEVSGCSIYANFPSGSGPAEIQRCLGRCYNTHYQTCCNGVTCIRNYERCCNSTCCNDHTGTCIKGIRSGARGFASNNLFWNRFAQNNQQVPVGRNVEFEQCSTVEQIDPINAFWIFILPAVLLLAALILTAMALVFANKVTATPLTFLEKLMLFGGIIVVALACALFFSPVWKYGVVAVLAGVLIIVNAATRVRWLNILTLVIVFFVLLFWVDPFGGNAIGSFASGRQEPNGLPDYHTSGVFSSIGRHWYNRNWLWPSGDEDMFNARQYCWRHYNYFMLDANLRDLDRHDNPTIGTFGYCSYQWIVALLFVAGFILLLLLLLLLLVLLAMILRFRKARFEPIELEVVDSDEIPY